MTTMHWEAVSGPVHRIDRIDWGLLDPDLQSRVIRLREVFNRPGSAARLNPFTSAAIERAENAIHKQQIERWHVRERNG